MKFDNKIRVTKENMREIEMLVGEKLFEGDIVYLEPSDFEYMQSTKEPDLLSFLYQENDKYLLIWDEDYGLNVYSNSFAFEPTKIKELEKDLDNCLLSGYGDNN